MKVISLLQPWATLVVIGAKKIETRSWNTKYRGELLIHASKNYEKGRSIAMEPPFRQYMPSIGKKPKGYNEGAGFYDWNALPFGAIIGKVNLVDTCKTTDIILMKECNIPIKVNGNNIPDEWEKEIAFGDYSKGRYGWLFSDPVQFAVPISAKGSLSLWDFDMPDHIHLPIKGGHATFPTPPDKETLDAVNSMAELAYKYLGNKK
jgi:hypothetical protein